MSNQLTGQIIYIGATEYPTEKFSKREVVLKTTDEQYPQELIMQVTQNKCELLNKYNVGDVITVSYNLRGRKANNDKWYNTIEIWKIGQ